MTFPESTPCSSCGQSNERGFPSHSELPPLPHHLLETNEVPTAVEATALNAAVDECRTRIAQLDTTITTLQALVEKHRRMRQAAAEQIRQSAMICSVVRRLPTDVLAEIFHWTIPDEPRKKPTNRCPWVLGRVCSYWRTVSISLPELWTHIDRKIPLRMVKAHLERSLPYPLTVELGYSDTGSVELLVASSSRWADADVEMRAFMESMLAHIEGQLPILRRLKYSGNVSGFRSFTAFATAPALRDVVLSPGKASVQLPWEQLLRLNLRLTESTGLAQLRLAHNLVALTLAGLPYGTPPQVELPRLHTLHIKDGGFLQHFVVPAMEDMYVNMDVSAVPALVDRSACPLRRFTTDGQCAAADIIAILEVASTLEELRVSAIADVQPLLARLTVIAHVRPLTPKLCKLTVSNVADEAACTQLVTMMRSRRAGVDCLEPSLCVLDFIKWAKLNLNAVQTLEILRQEGFQVEWLTGAHSMEKYRTWRSAYP
ncbi:hypothetical protein C8R43DRAFT_316419 [Mycena crocata]|nr:hypothetical protein C8R43DRAFT_316419 [Mycena crocata]